MGIGVSIFLLATGAILAFAVTIDPTPAAGMTIEWNTVGVILMFVGLIGFAWSIYMMQAWRGRRTMTTDDVVVTERERTIDPRL